MSVGRVAVVEEVGDEILWQQVDVLGKEGDEHLQDEALGHAGAARRRALWADQALEAVGQRVGGFAGDGDAVVVEGGLVVAGERGRRAAPSGRAGRRGAACPPGVSRSASRSRRRGTRRSCRGRRSAGGWGRGGSSSRRPGGSGAGGPCRASSFRTSTTGFQTRSAKAVPPPSSAAWRMRNSVWPPTSRHARLAEGLEEAVEEDLGLALFVAGDVLLRPADKLSELFLTRHGRVLQERRGGG